MESVKLSITCRKALEKKYEPAAQARIAAAIKKWIKANAQRGIKTVHVEIDDAKAMKRLGVAPVTGKVTANKVKTALDALCARLMPDYVVLIGAGDVVPFFSVANPSRHADGDTDPAVPTDNPYASSQPFRAKKRETYLVPDRVVGRIPDLLGSDDSKWLVDYLEVAKGWTSLKSSTYAKDLLVCCDEWKKSGSACVEFLSRDAKSMLICPPDGDESKLLRRRHRHLLQMIKCHGAELDSSFYGQKKDDYPEVLRSSSIAARTRSGTIVGAMCCFGASVFDPNDAAAVTPGAPPIPSVYLRQGAYGFVGSTTTAWVGFEDMQCADWIVASFLKGVLGGASLGRAALEAKQDFVRWTEQQGEDLDAASEKTLMQFVLLGDPSIHPVSAPQPAGLAPAGVGVAIAAAKTAGAGAVQARRVRRQFRRDLAVQLTGRLPERVAVAPARKKPPGNVTAAARALAKTAGKRFSFRLSRPGVYRLRRRVERPRPTGRAIAGIKREAVKTPLESLQYYWVASRDEGPIREIRMVMMDTDKLGRILRAKVLASA